MVTAAVTRLQPDQPLEAAGYIRVSRKVQAEGHSPDIQREAIKRLARQEGYILTDDMIEEDHERGSKVTRQGYQRIMEHVREGRAATVLVYMFDRWGRDGVEWLARARELDRLGVPIISVVEGKDEGGLMRFVRAGMAQWYSEQLAKRVRPAREKAAREGVHAGSTPYGYKRVSPAWDGKGRRPHGHLVPDEATAWVVRELFIRYATGLWSVHRLAVWLNADSTVPPPRRAQRWGTDAVRSILHNRTYKGIIHYNEVQRGLYESAAPGSAFDAPGQHERLVSDELFDQVQRRLAEANTRPTFTRWDAPLPLAARLLQCAECGGQMVPKRRTAVGGQYACVNRIHGRTSCSARSYQIDTAHAALLAEVCRLRHHDWTPEAEEHVLGPQLRQEAESVGALQRALDQERETLRTYARRIATMATDPTPEEQAAFNQVRAEFTARIRSLEAQLAQRERPRVNLPSLRALHDRFSRTPLHSLIATLRAQRNEAALRDLLLTLVQSARVIERTPGRYSRWLRMDVAWTADVQTLLDAGLFWLDAPPQTPRQPTRAERYHQTYLRRKARRLAAPQAPSGTAATAAR